MKREYSRREVDYTYKMEDYILESWDSAGNCGWVIWHAFSMACIAFFSDGGKKRHIYKTA